MWERRDGSYSFKRAGQSNAFEFRIDLGKFKADAWRSFSQWKAAKNHLGSKEYSILWYNVMYKFDDVA